MPNPWTGKGNPYTRKEVRDRLMSTIKKGDAIIAAGAPARILRAVDAPRTGMPATQS